MTNDKDIFSQLDELFEDVDVDQAALLAGGEIEPTQEDYEKELIQKLNNNEIELTDKVIEEVKKVIKEGGEVDQRITEFLREKLNISEEVERTEPEVIAETRDDTPYLFDTEPEESPTEVIDHIQLLANQLGGYVKKNNLQQKSEPEVADALTEKVEYLTNQLGIIRQTLDEQGKTIVSGIGQGGDGQTPGSGEVRLQKQDDVDMDGIKPGQTLCWDPDMYSGTGGWYPCDGGGGGGGGTIQPPTTGAVFGCKRVKDCADLYWGPLSVYETWFDGGNLFGDLTGAKLIKNDIKAITGAIAMSYEPQGTVPETFYSKEWNAVGVVDCNDVVLDSDSISTEGISSPVGPEGYFLVFDDPDGCGEDQEGCEPLPINPIGCPVLEPTDEYTNKLVWGTQDDYDNYDVDTPTGVPIEKDGSEIEGVLEIKAVTFEGCDRDSMRGKYNVYYTNISGAGIKIVSIYDDTFGVENRSAFIADAECDTNIPEEPIPPTIPGCLATDGCKEVSDVDTNGDPNNDGKLYWGNGIEAESLPVEDNGLQVDGVQKLLFVISAPGTRYVVEDDGTITGDWQLTYQKFDGNNDTVIYEGTIDPTTCEIGFFIVSDNECLNPAEEKPEEGTTLPWPGNIVGCEAIDDVASQGQLKWGDGTDDGEPCFDEPGSNGNMVLDCKRILFVFSTDLAVNETDKTGIWSAIYEKIGGGYGLGYSPTTSDDGTTDGFFIFDEGFCLDDTSDLPELQFGIFTGCRERLVASQLYWGRKSQYISLTGEDVNYSNGNLAINIKRVYRPMTLDNKVYFGIVVNDLNQTRLVTHRQDGTETSSPPFGFYLLGDCLVDVEDENCPLDEKEYAEPEGCRETVDVTNLLWGPISDIDTFAVSEVVDTDVIKILNVSTQDKCDNNYGKWNCLYIKLVGDVEEVRQATREGIYTADPVEDSMAFFLDTSAVECKDDPGDITGDGVPVRGEITGCRKTLLTTGTTLHWGDGTTGIDVSDVDGNIVTDATFIIGVVSFDSDNVRFGNWICLFNRADGTQGTAITYGQSPTEGYYLDDTNCDPEECEGEVYFGYLPDCNRVDPNHDAGELYWNDGDGNSVAITDGGTQVLVRRVLATFTVDDCSNDDFDITEDQVWSALYLDENSKFSITGQQLGKSPLGGYYIEVDEVDSYCDYSTDKPIGGRCEGDDDCPEGFVCVGGICAQIECPGGDRDCPAGFLCVEGICLQPCGDEIGQLCPPGFHCETIGNESYCVPGNGCNGDCPEGYHCLDGECVIIECPLNSTNECPNGYECVGGLCLKPCPDGNCPDGFQCIDGHCHPIYGPCTVPCPPGYECILGACREYCDVNDDQCGEGFLCYNGICLPECPPEGCPVGHVCVGGICLPIGPGPELPAGCNDGTDCPVPPTGELWDCINGHCRPVCQPDGTGCPGDLVCIDGGCYPPCDGTECPPGYECLLGACIPVIGCDADGNCPSGLECIDGVCRPACNNDSDCPPGFECGPNGGCYKPCDDGTCPEGFMCIGGLCIPNIKCDDDAGCPTGFECFDGICRPDCSSISCPPGYECFNGVCFPTCPGGSDSECPPGHECVGGGICLPIIGCDDNADCPDGFECFNGKCRPVCTDDSQCPGDMECVDGVCLKPCNGDNDCPSGFVCWNGHCVPGGRPEGECGEDGACPPGYICILGICRPECVVDGDCPNDNETCLLPPGGCFPAQCQEDDDCPNGTICVDGRCRVGCNLNSDCPEGYSCIDGICLPTIPEGPDVEQPVDPGPNEHPKIGCEEVDVEGYLYWGDENDYATGSGGELVLKNGSPILVKKIELIVATNVYPNGFGTYTCFYRPPGSSEIESVELERQSPVDGMVNSYYIQPINGSVCINFGETHEPYFGLIAGCKETDNGGTVHWGTIAEGVSDNYPNEALKNEDGTNIIAKGIITVFSIDSVDPEDGIPGQNGIWNIFYQNLNGTNGLVKVYGRSGPQGPEGAFMRSSEGSVCIDNPLGRVTTRDVILVNSPRLIETSNRFFGDRRQTLGDGPQGTNDIIGPNGELIRYETQEQANTLNLDILNEIHTLKPTVHIISDINDVKGHYVPQRGDLWIDPTDYSIYVCEFRTPNPTDDDLINRPDENILWIELGAASGGGEDNTTQSFSNIWLQDAEPPKSIAKNGDLWIDAETYIMYTYNFQSQSWVSVTGDLKAVLDNRFEVHMDTLPPAVATTKSGDLWFDTEAAEMRVAYIPSGSTTFVWVPVQGTGFKSIPATTAFELNEEVEDLKNEISRMSARLSALEAQGNQ